MRNVKNALLILLVVLLLAAGSLLPMGAAALQDKTTANVVQYEDIEALQLKLEEQEPKLSYQEKLFLMVNGTGVEVAEDVMRLNGGEVIEAVYAGLQPYVGSGFFPKELSNDMLEYHPVMVYGDTDPESYNFYWWVLLSLDIYEEDTLTVILDDETGSILAMDFIAPYEYVADVYYESVYAIADLYFGNLGITPADAMQIDTEGLLDESVDAVQDPGDSHAVMQFQIVDVLYGGFHIEICVHTNGFYIMPV